MKGMNNPPRHNIQQETLSPEGKGATIQIQKMTIA